MPKLNALKMSALDFYKVKKNSETGMRKEAGEKKLVLQNKKY
jgi:hypothetical protein